tara:strand:+ start:1013 stop:1444 length:432 start_codon:yes stop_codon:yes gene_type:complete
MDAKRIIMNFTTPPSLEDMEALAALVLEHLPEELGEYCQNLSVLIEEFPDEAMEQELDLKDPFDLLALYRSGREISPGVERKTANDDGILILFRRPILDLWCEQCDDLNIVLRQVIVEELGRNFDFSEDEIDEMSERHFQGMF